MKNVFLEKSFTKVVEKLLPDPFLKNQIEHIPESISKSLMQFVGCGEFPPGKSPPANSPRSNSPLVSPPRSIHPG